MPTKYQIRLQIVATADDDGANAANIAASTVTSRLTTLNQVFAPATVEFVFDAANDFLKISSTVLNRDFTPLELPNVGSDKWNHEPLIDEETHTRARLALCRQFPGKLVVIFRNRKKLEEGEDGNWSIVDKGGGSSSSNSLFVNMSTISNGVDLAHEIGHYLQLPHPFVGNVKTVADAAAKIKKYVENGHAKADGLEALDGDRRVLLDTPADCAGSIFVSLGLDPCGTTGKIDIPVTFSDASKKTYVLEPNRNLVMSYFKGCSATGAKTLSAEQARRVRDGLELRHRHHLISVKPSFNHRITRGGVGTGGAIGELDVAMVRAGRLATVVRDGSDNLKVIVWDIEDAGEKITRRGSLAGGAVGRVSVCGLGSNMIATAVITGSNQLKVIIWRIDENGDVTRLGDAAADGEVTDVACCAARYNMANNYMATAVRRDDGTLKVDVWETFANGDVVLRSSATAGKINVPKSGINTPRLSICRAGAQSLATSVRTEATELKTILWEFDDEKLVRIGDAPFDEASIGSLANCHAARETAVVAFQDKDKKLRLLGYGFPEDGRYIEARGTASAGAISHVGICPIGTEIVLTGVRAGSDKLKMILWQVTKSADFFVRLDDATTDETYSRFAMCSADRNQAATAFRDAGGNLKIIVWRLTSKIQLTSADDVFKAVFQQVVPSKDAVKKTSLSRGGECFDDEIEEKKAR